MAIINHNSISGINTISVGSSIVIGDNFVLNANGIENVNGINITGVITASSFVGDGSTLTGIDATALKDTDGNVIVQAEASGINVTGVSTFGGNVSVAGTFGVTDISYFYNDVRLARDGNGLNFSTNSSGSQITNTTTGDLILKNNLTGSNNIILNTKTDTLARFLGNAGVELYYDNNKKFETTAGGVDITGHTELDNVRLSGVLTATSAEFTGDVTVLGDLTYENVTNLDSVGVATARSGLRITGGGLEVTGVSTFQDNVNLGDNDRLNFGDDGDLRIYHDGTSSVVVDLAGGGLYLSGSNSVIISDELGIETLASFTKGGSAELYYADEKKLETADSGINVVGTTTTGQLSVTGVSTFTGNVSVGSSILLGDFNRILFGDDDDMSMYFDGTRLKITPKNPSSTTSQLDFEAKDQVYIESKTNGIFLRGNNQSIIDMYGGANGGIYFHHNNTDKLKLESGNWTTLNGADWTFTGANYNSIWDASANTFRFNDDAKATFGASDDLQIYHSGNQSFIHDAGSGSLIVKADEFFIQNAAGTETKAYFQTDAQAQLYYNNSVKIATTNTGISVTGQIDVSTTSILSNGDISMGDNDVLRLGAGDDLQIYHDGTYNNIKSSNGELHIKDVDGGYWIRNEVNGAVSLYYDGSLRVNTYSGGIQVNGVIVADAFLSASRYWRFVGGSTVSGHAPRASRIVLSDGTSDYTIQTFTSDNCSDSGTIYSNGSVYSYDFGSGNDKSICKAKLYVSYSGARGANYSVQYSLDNSTWLTAFSGVMESTGSCGLLTGTGGLC